MNLVKIKILLLFAFIDSGVSIERFLLDNWNLTDLKGTRNISIQTKAPGGIYTDLQENGLIGDIYYRFNDIDLRWIAETEWVYRTSFFNDHDGPLDIEFQGLDTAATIEINGKVIGTTDNMFRKYVYKISQIGLLEISVIFTSPVSYATDRFIEQSEDHIVPPACVPEQFQGFCHANHIRKMQASFSWDWGPAAPSVGIWRPATVISWQESRIVNVDWDTTLVGKDDSHRFTFQLIFNILIKVDAKFSGTLETVIKLSFNDMTIKQTVTISSAHDEEYLLKTEPVEVTISSDDLWWPNGFGKQNLYDVSIQLNRDNINLDEMSLLSSLGFRDIKLVEEKLDKGKSFYFEVNGMPIFMKGSNWIPAHVLPEKSTSEYVKDLLHSAKEANMNMLRVWGGGIYESDEFYNLADQYGILIWQDFMFACSMYPANEEFLETVSEEVKYQVSRLKIHPSVALWAANNENEAALRTNWYGTDTNYSVYLQDYKRLYADTISKIVKDLDPARSILLSSPSNGVIQDDQECIYDDPYSVLSGDIHFYNYRDNNWDSSIYPIPRFASEYGFQSYSDFNILKQYSQDEDWAFDSEWIKHRQHHPDGDIQLLWQIKLNMYVDEKKLHSDQGLDYMVYLSQIYQAISLKVETEHYRRNKNVMNTKGEGLTMGALYWQLNDIWPGVSWASLEYGGSWKMAHYFAKNFFSPILLSPQIEDDIVNVHILCDIHQDSPVELQIRILKWNLEEAYAETLPLVDYCYEYIVYSKSLSELLKLGDCSVGTSENYRLKYCFIEMNLINTESGEMISQNTVHAPPNGLTGVGEDMSALIKQPNVVINSIYISNEITEEPYVEAYDIELSSESLALFVWIQSNGIKGTFSDNGFHMTTSTKRVQFNSKEHTDVEQLLNTFTVRAYQPY